MKPDNHNNLWREISFRTSDIYIISTGWVRKGIACTYRYSNKTLLIKPGPTHRLSSGIVEHLYSVHLLHYRGQLVTFSLLINIHFLFGFFIGSVEYLLSKL